MTTSAQDTAPTTDEVTAWLGAFTAALEARDVEQAVSLFLPEGCTWRDFLAFTWNITTEAGPDAIRAMLASTLADVEPADWAVVGTPGRSDGFTEAWLSFSTRSARARAHVRLVGGKALTFFTAMEELKGHEEPTGPRRAMGNIHEPVKGRTSWIQDRTRHQERFGYDEQPFCVVIGGGQSGIIMGARLKRLGVPTLIVDRN